MIAAISPIPTLPDQVAPSTAPTSQGEGGFSTAIGNAVDSLQGVQNEAATLEAQAAAGQGSITNTMVAASEASLATEVTTSVIDKALSAYDTIAGMAF